MAEIKCPCGEWHERTGLRFNNVELIACPNAPGGSLLGGVFLPGQGEIRDGQDA